MSDWSGKIAEVYQMFASHWPRDAACCASFRHYIPLPIVGYLLVTVREHLSKGNIHLTPSLGNIRKYPSVIFFREYKEISSCHLL
jgi:hypothetical protein